MIITHPRLLSFETPLGGETVVRIAAPRSAHGQKAARVIRDTLQSKEAQVEWHDDPEGSFMRTANGPIIVMGNLADNQCIRELYHHSLCVTDLCYPGPGGSELRTLGNPWGTGHNVILIGYSDEEGAAQAAQGFIGKISDSIPHLRELNITRLPIADVDLAEYRAYQLPETAPEVANTMESDNIGYVYYLTGEPALGEVYRQAWQAILSCGYERTENVVQSHLFSLWRFLPWRLIEHTGLFDDKERLAITRYLYGWAQSDEGWRHVANHPHTQRPHNPQGNHQLIPALALMHVANYFETHYPELPGPDRWREAGRQAFRAYGSSWKPICGGLCHGIAMSLPIILEYGLIDPEHRFFQQGGARQAAEYALAIVNNDGWIPAAGDSGVTRQFPGPILRIAADFLHEGRYKYLHDRAPYERRFGWQPSLCRAYDSGVSPEMPRDHLGVKVIPVDPLLYHVWEQEPEIAADFVTTPPSAPIEQCFDVIAVRTGWDLADDYLLIDGLGGGGHAYDDASAILDYARLGVSMIVQEDSLLYTAPEHHSLVTIVRDGESGAIPGFAILEEHHRARDGTIYLRLRSRDYAGADWVREVYLFPGKCVAFIDTVTAKVAGDYAIEAHFRTPGRINLEGNVAQGLRTSPCSGEVEIRFESSLHESQLDVIDLPMHLRFPTTKDQQLWQNRYHSDEMILMSMEARATSALQSGESVRFAHLAQVRAAGESCLHLQAEGEEYYLIEGDIRTPLESYQAIKPIPHQQPEIAPRASGAISLVHRANDKITALDLDEQGTLFVGTKSGRLTAIGLDSATRWIQSVAGPIHDIGVAPAPSPLIVIGHGEADLCAFATNGNTLWNRKITREPSPWPWWELTTPAPIQVAGGISDGEVFFAVGCGDIQVRGFDSAGNENWTWRYNEGVPGRMTTADVDGSGRTRIVVGGEILSDQATCRILEPDGTQIAELEVEGWTSLLTAVAFGQSDQRHFIGCGANRGNNLHLYELIDNQWKRRWKARLGGQVRSIAIFADTGQVLVATSQGFLLCYDLEGNEQWHILFEQGLQHMAQLKHNIMAIDKNGTLRLVGLSGEIRQELSLPSPCSQVITHHETLYLVCAQDLWGYSISS